jgi:hypothetical protein
MRHFVACFIVLGITASTCSCLSRSDLERANEAKVDSLRKDVVRFSQESSSLETLVSLDVLASDSANREVQERIERAKRLIATHGDEPAFAIAAMVVDVSEKDATKTIAIFAYNRKGEIAGVDLLDRDRAVLAAGEIPEAVTKPTVPCWRFFVKLREVSGQPRFGFVDNNVLEIQAKKDPVVFVAVRRSNGKSDAVVLQPRDALRIAPG